MCIRDSYQVVLGDVYMQNGKKQDAYEIYKKVLAEEPDLSLIHICVWCLLAFISLFLKDLRRKCVRVADWPLSRGLPC